jgi:hypothetical protein
MAAFNAIALMAAFHEEAAGVDTRWKVCLSTPPLTDARDLIGL